MSLFRILSQSIIVAAALAAGTQADASIIALPLPADILPGTFPTSGPLTSTWDVNGGGGPEFSFTFFQPQLSVGLDWQATVTGFAGSNASVLGFFGATNDTFALRLNNGNPVVASGANSFLSGVPVTLATRVDGVNSGSFLGPVQTTGFIGFSFMNGTDTFYGYLGLTVIRNSGIVFHSAAYNDVPGGSIFAAATPVPEPGTLAVLAFGLAALGVTNASKRARD